MTIFGLFLPLYLLLGWGIYAIINRLISRDEKRREQIFFSLGVIGLVMLIGQVFTHGLAVINGYLGEQLKVGTEVFGYLFLIINSLELIIAILATLALIGRWRRDQRLRIIQVVLILCYILLNFTIYGLLRFDYVVSLLPGWQAISVTLPSYTYILLWVFIAFGIDMIARRFFRAYPLFK